MTVSVRLLNDQERETVGGAIAWLIAAASESEALEPTAWHALIQDVVAHDVAFTVDGPAADRLDSTWWADVMEQAIEALIEVNRLAEPIRRLSAAACPPGKMNRLVS